MWRDEGTNPKTLWPVFILRTERTYTGTCRNASLSRALCGMFYGIDDAGVFKHLKRVKSVKSSTARGFDECTWIVIEFWLCSWYRSHDCWSSAVYSYVRCLFWFEMFHFWTMYYFNATLFTTGFNVKFRAAVVCRWFLCLYQASLAWRYVSQRTTAIHHVDGELFLWSGSHSTEPWKFCTWWTCCC